MSQEYLDREVEIRLAEAQTWFGPLVAVGEFLVGIALLLGVFTGIAAFFGAFMSWTSCWPEPQAPTR